MKRLRWWLARRIAPAPVMWDAFPELDEGVFVYMRQSGATTAFKADKFRMKSRLVLRPWFRDADLDRVFGETHDKRTTFVGTVAR